MCVKTLTLTSPAPHWGTADCHSHYFTTLFLLPLPLLCLCLCLILLLQTIIQLQAAQPLQKKIHHLNQRNTDFTAHIGAFRLSVGPTTFKFPVWAPEILIFLQCTFKWVKNKNTVIVHCYLLPTYISLNGWGQKSVQSLHSFMDVDHMTVHIVHSHICTQVWIAFKLIQY